MKFQIVILCLLLFQEVNSQNSTDIKISGNLMSLSSGYPIENANIYFTETLGTSSDKNGNYVLSFPGNLLNSQITISAIGFVTKSIKGIRFSKK